MKITCIIPTCDRPEFLSESLRSVFAQTRLPDEIIVVNNGQAPVRLLGEFSGRVKIYDIMPYAGVAQARNFGASVATSELLTFLDDDDLWSPGYLQGVEGAFLGGADCVISRLDQLSAGKLAPFKNAAGKITLKHILVYNPGITGTNTAVSKTAFFAVGGYDPKLPPSEDKSLVLEMLLSRRQVVALPDNQAIIRQHSSGARLTDPGKIAEGIYQFLRKYGRQMGRHERWQNQLKIYRYRWQAGRRAAFVPFVWFYVLTRIDKWI